MNLPKIIFEETLRLINDDKSSYYSYLIETSIMANIRYFPSSGTTNDVGGMISTTSRKNT